MKDLFRRYMDNLEKSDGSAMQAFSPEEVAESVAVLLKQMVLADGVEREVELAAALGILRSSHADALAGGASDLETLLGDIRNESIFPVCRIIFASMAPRQIAELRKGLERIAMADGEMHAWEQDLLGLFDRLTSPAGGSAGN